MSDQIPAAGSLPVSNPTPEGVEKVAKAMWAADHEDWFPWAEARSASRNRYRRMAEAAIAALQLKEELPLGTVQRDDCTECGAKVYRHADAPWLHIDSGLRWCYRDPESREVAVVGAGEEQ